MAGEQTQTTETTTTENKPPEWVTDLKATMTEVGKGIGTLVTLAQQSTQRQAPPVVEEQEDNTDILDEVTLETLPRRAFAQKLLESLEGTLDKKLGPITEAITKQATDLLTSNYVREAEAFAAKTKDFGEWAEEMQVIARDNPDLAISRIYAIAKSENPVKAVEIAKKYATPETTTETVKKKAPLALSTQSQSGEVKNQKMNAEDAARAAWDETVAKFGGNPFG